MKTLGNLFAPRKFSFVICDASNSIIGSGLWSAVNRSAARQQLAKVYRCKPAAVRFNP